MSKNNNVNPGQYKVAGRERQGEDIAHEEQKAAESINEQEVREESRRSKKDPEQTAGE